MDRLAFRSPVDSGQLGSERGVNRLCGLAGYRTDVELTETMEMETAQLVEEPRQAGGHDHWNTRIRPALLKTDS